MLNSLFDSNSLDLCGKQMHNLEFMDDHKNVTWNYCQRQFNALPLHSTFPIYIQHFLSSQSLSKLFSAYVYSTHMISIWFIHFYIKFPELTQFNLSNLFRFGSSFRMTRAGLIIIVTLTAMIKFRIKFMINLCQTVCLLLLSCEMCAFVSHL